MIWKLEEYKTGDNLCVNKVIKELKILNSLISSLNNVPVKAEAFQISIGILTLDRMLF